MIRASRPEDTKALLSLTRGTGVFKSFELDVLEQVFADYYSYNYDIDHVSVTFDFRDGPQGFAYYAPAEMTDRTWYLWWIVVRKDLHAGGIGSQLLLHLERDIRERDGRVLFVETSSKPNYELTRRFYVKHGYDQEAVLRDYYADGDSMVMFRKYLCDR